MALAFWQAQRSGRRRRNIEYDHQGAKISIPPKSTQKKGLHSLLAISRKLFHPIASNAHLSDPSFLLSSISSLLVFPLPFTIALLDHSGLCFKVVSGSLLMNAATMSLATTNGWMILSASSSFLLSSSFTFHENRVMSLDPDPNSHSMPNV